MAKPHLSQAVFCSGSIAVPDELIHAVLKLFVEGDAVSSEGVGD